MILPGGGGVSRTSLCLVVTHVNTGERGIVLLCGFSVNGVTCSPAAGSPHCTLPGHVSVLMQAASLPPLAALRAAGLAGPDHRGVLRALATGTSGGWSLELRQFPGTALGLSGHVDWGQLSEWWASSRGRSTECPLSPRVCSQLGLVWGAFWGPGAAVLSPALPTLSPVWGQFTLPFQWPRVTYFCRMGFLPIHKHAFLLEQIGKAGLSAPENAGGVGERAAGAGVQAGGAGQAACAERREGLTQHPSPTAGRVFPLGVHDAQGALGPG